MKPRSRSRLALESLESRETPAVTIVNATTAILTDIDGDKATVKVSAGTLTAGLFTTAAKGPGDQLQTINFSAGGFDGANLTISAIKVATGDGLVNVGYINSTGHDLGTVTVKGDLGQIDAGDAVTTTPGLKALSVRSLGRFSIDTQAAGGNLESNINGAFGSLTVAGDVKEAYVKVTGSNDGMIGPISIGGSLIGGSNNNSGLISSDGDMGAVKIGHNVQGGSGADSGFVLTFGQLESISIGGSLIGGAGSVSGYIYSNGDMGVVKIRHDVQGGPGLESGVIAVNNGKCASVNIGGSLIGSAGVSSGVIYSNGDMGAVRIGHDVQGGLSNYSGLILTNGKLASLKIGGSLIGGAGIESGEVFSSDNMGVVAIGHSVLGGTSEASGLIFTRGTLTSVSIGGSLIGGAATKSGLIFSDGEMSAIKIAHNVVGGSIIGAMASLVWSGAILSQDRIANVVIGGSVIAGIDTSTVGSLTGNASIMAGNDIGSLTVKGNLIGNSNANGDSPVIISARGQAVQGATTDVAIGKITIGGWVENARILAGYDTDLTPKNADAQIGAVTIGGDWAGSSIVAGVDIGADNLFGTADDAKISGGTDNPNIISKIASVTIKGLVYGTPASSGADHFGFVAQQIGSFKCLGFMATLTAGTDLPIELALTTGDVTIREVA